MYRLSLTAVALLLASASQVVAEDGAPGLVGQKAPELQTKEWLNSDGRTRIADYAGEVVLVEAFATWCGPCRGQMPHLTELTKKYGKKGLTVLSITNEPRETVLKYMSQLNTAPVEYTIGLGGGNGGYKTQFIPHAWLVGAEGNVVWEGSPGGLSEKILDAELKKVVAPTPEALEARAGLGLKFANELAKANRYVEALAVLDRVAAKYKGTTAATQATERKAALESDQAVAADVAAQKQIAKLVGAAEFHKDKVKDKQRESLAAKLEAAAKENEGKNPGAVALAQMWHTVMSEEWTAEK